MLNYTIEVEQEEDGRWLAEIVELPGVMAYGADREEAERAVLDLAQAVERERSGC